MNQNEPRPGARVRARCGLLLAAGALLLAGWTAAACGGNPVAVATEAVTLRPTFTPTLLPSATVTPQQTVESTEAAPSTPIVPPETPSAEPVSSATVIVTNTPIVVTATPTAEPPAPTPSPTPTAAPRPRMESPGYGMQAFLWWRPEVAQRDLEKIRDAGFGWVKQAFAWRDVEGTGKGQFDWSTTDRIVQQVEQVGGLRLIVRLDSDPSWASGQAYPNPAGILMTPPRRNQDLADFCRAVAARYKGRIAAYQVWNEPNLSREWGGGAPDPAAYTALLKACYQGVKSGDPAAIVISAGMAPTTRFDQVAIPDTEFLRRMYRAGAQPYFDALGAHGAGYKAPPEMDPGQVATDPNYYNVGDVNCGQGPACRIYCFRHVEDLHQIMVDNGDSGKQVVVLEFGWTMDPRPDSPYRWHAVTEDQQADYLVRAYQYAKDMWQPWIGVMSLIYMPNVDWTESDEQYWWSIAIPNYPQFYPYRSYRELARMPK